jgi:ATP-binding cassette subfamily F protein 3
LKKALQQYKGTFLIVSHDREFLDGLTNRIWDIENQSLKIHHFGVHEYLQRKLEKTSMNESPKAEKKVEKNAVSVEENSEKVVSHEERKEWKKLKNSLQNKVKQNEERVAELEKELKKLEDELAIADFSDSAKTTPLLKQFEETKSKLDFYSDLWMEAAEQLENLVEL